MGLFVAAIAIQLLSGFCSAGPASVPTKLGSCWTIGGPHYRTFDGQYYNFMGNCTYTMVKNSKTDEVNPAFEVHAKNMNAALISKAAGMVSVRVYSVKIDIVSSEVGLVRINSEQWNLPITLENGKVRLAQSGFSVVMETDFGLMVQYDWQQHLVVVVPDSFAGRVYGMCGNFNGKPEDDFTTPSGTVVSDVATLGNSWRSSGLVEDGYCSDQCTGECETCDSSFIHKLEGEMFCKLLSSIIDGPLKECQAAVNPKPFYANCLYDFCRLKGMKTYLCDMLQVYTDTCQRAGVKVYNWRGFAHCPEPACPENSHFELCGSPCPATCEDPEAPSKCKTHSCVEACICNQGFIQSGNKCVPKPQCGCLYQGRYVEAGTSFWADVDCTKQCNCSAGGNLVTQSTSCLLEQQCQVADGVLGCQPVTFATCMVSGDPHYLTFDGERYNFQGTCVYQMAGVCSNDTSLEHFTVAVQNDGRDKKIGSITKLVEVKVYGNTVVISKEHPGHVLVNGELSNLPMTLESNKLQLYKSGWFAVVETDFGVTVSYDWNSVSIITIPSTYTGAMCGLCGNYNHDLKDDLQMKDGKQAATAEELGQSWRVATIPGCVNGCQGPCPDCDITQRDQYATNKYCGLISDPTGPFRDCHSKVEPAGFFQDCLYDVCLYQGSRNMQCKTLTAYTAACQEQGVTVYSWRSSNFCDAKCPTNGHYELCGNACPASCQSPSPPPGCEAQCREGCVCNDGFVASGDQCVPLAQCGCLYNDRYYKNGQVFYPNGLCAQECTCNGKVECKAFSCGPNEKCEVKNGVRACQPIGKGVCSISGDPHYNTFDNTSYDFQGTCTYTAAQACHLEGTHLIPFSVVVENEKWYAMSEDPKVSVAKLVAVEVYGNTLILRRNQIGMVMLNGVLLSLPLSLRNGAVQVYQEGTYDVILTDFGLRVTYDLVYHVTVTVPSNYKDKTCGLCGNFNDNSDDEYQLPDGQMTKDIISFGGAWKVDLPGVVCDDGCSGDLCPECDESKKTVFESDCGIMTNPNGPFAICHNVIDPASYYRDCVFDICMAGGDRNMLCHSISAYMVDCQDFGVNIPNWRSPTFCPLGCPANSHYQVCSETCATPCPGLADTITCPTTCAEGCACDSGFFYNGTSCVALDQCGCYHEGHTYKIGESVMSEECLEVNVCQTSGVLLSQPTGCYDGDSCQVRDSVRGCYPKECVIGAGGVLTPFSGQVGVITATGAYEIVTLCDKSLAENGFRVVVTFETVAETGFNSVVAVYVFFDDLIISVTNKHETLVNCKAVSLPSFLKNDISIKEAEGTLTIEKKSILQVSYSLYQEISVTVDDQIKDKLCGACGAKVAAGSNKLLFSLQARATNLNQQYVAKWITSNFPQCDV